LDSPEQINESQVPDAPTYAIPAYLPGFFFAALAAFFILGVSFSGLCGMFIPLLRAVASNRAFA